MSRDGERGEQRRDARQGLSRRVVLASAASTALAALASCTRGGAPSAETSSPFSVSPPASSRVPRSPGPTTPAATPAPIHPTQVTARHIGVAPSAWGVDLPGIVARLDRPTDDDGVPRIALTLDACGGGEGGGYDAALIEGLRASETPATLFLNRRWIEQNPRTAAELAADPLFVLGNHGTRHVPLSVTGRAAYGIAGTASVAEAVEEVWTNHGVLTELTGVAPRYFRAGTAHYDDVGVRIARELGEMPVGFTVNGDGGATFAAGTVRHEVAVAPPGAIVLAHMNQPQGATAEGLLAAIGDLRARGARLVPLEV